MSQSKALRGEIVFQTINKPGKKSFREKQHLHRFFNRKPVDDGVSTPAWTLYKRWRSDFRASVVTHSSRVYGEYVYSTVQFLYMSDRQIETDTQPSLDELITLSEAAELCGFTTRHLRYLAVNGELWAKKLGRNWFTTAQAVQEYLARDRRPGPKSK